MIVTFSGIDGSGKSTAAQAMVQDLQANGVAADLCSPRYMSNQVVKTFCQDTFGDPYAYVPNLDPTFYICCLLSDWLDLLNRELRHHEGRIVVCDRYIYDVLAQGIHYGADLAPALAIVRHFPPAAFSFLLEIAPDEAHNRLQLRDVPPIHHLEALPHLRKLDDAYQRIRETTEWRPIVLRGDSRRDAYLEVIECLRRPGTF